MVINRDRQMWTWEIINKKMDSDEQRLHPLRRKQLLKVYKCNLEMNTTFLLDTAAFVSCTGCSGRR